LLRMTGAGRSRLGPRALAIQPVPTPTHRVRPLATSALNVELAMLDLESNPESPWNLAARVIADSRQLLDAVHAGIQESKRSVELSFARIAESRELLDSQPDASDVGNVNARDRGGDIGC